MPGDLGTFTQRWHRSAASERANYQRVLVELCHARGLPHPDPATDEPEGDGYVFERAVQFRNPDGSTSPGFIDLYRRGSFVLETKQGCEAKHNPTLLEQTGAQFILNGLKAADLIPKQAAGG